MRVRPGDTIKVKIINELPKNDPPTGSANDPHNFNTTNLHTHGLHVSPSGNSDNVLARILPGHEFENEIKVPVDHPPGTFWYHGHVHGSTAIQVSSGMAGALIIEGGLDEVPAIRDAKENIMIFQQMPYRKADMDLHYVIEDYDDFGFGQWDQESPDTGWRTMINGQVFPAVRIQPGQVMRFLDDGGLLSGSRRSALTLQFSRLAQRSLTLRPACSRIIQDDLSRRLRQFCYLHCRSDCYRLERRSYRVGIAPTENTRLCTAH